MGPPHAIAPGEVVVSNPNFELKMYGPSATAADPNKRIWISGPPCPVNIWAGMCTTRFAATLRDKNNYVDLTGYIHDDVSGERIRLCRLALDEV